MRRLFCLAFIGAAGIANAQHKGEPISVHVKEVHREEDNELSSEKGTWFHMKAVAETKSIIYTLKCDEFYSYERQDYSVKCFNLVAGKYYHGSRVPTALIFWKPEDRNKGYTLTVYTIVSEKEK